LAVDARLVAVLREHGFEEAGGPPPDQQLNLVKEGQEFYVTLLEQSELCRQRLVTRSATTTPQTSRSCVTC
jgi:hypothetical protein